MEKNPFNEKEQDFFFPHLSTNEKYGIEMLKMNDNLSLDNDLKPNMTTFSFLETQNYKDFDLFKFKELNLASSDVNSNDSNSLNILQKKRNLSFDKKGEKEDLDKYLRDNLLRRVKKIALDSLLKFDNDIIKKIYKNNIGNGIVIKKLFKNNYFQIKCIGVVFNKELLKRSQGEILSSNITTRFTYYPLDHNKKLIEELINEKDLEKREIFRNIFNKTLLECIEHAIGKKHFKELEGLEIIFEKELLNLNENDEYKKQLKNVFNDIEKIYNEKKARKKKSKKNIFN